MTWDELADLFTELAEHYETKVHVTHQHGMSAVALHFVPVAWFISMKFTGELSMGVYEGEENRLRGTGSIPLAELTTTFVREKVQEAVRDQLVGSRLQSGQRNDGTARQAASEGRGRGGLRHLPTRLLSFSRPKFRGRASSLGRC